MALRDAGTTSGTLCGTSATRFRAVNLGNCRISHIITASVGKMWHLQTSSLPRGIDLGRSKCALSDFT